MSQPMFSPKSAPGRYSAKAVAKPVSFFCAAPEAQSVSIMGDFNQWNPAANPMQRQPDGQWLGRVNLTHGHHHYLFVVDGKPVLDPRAQGVGRNERNEKISLIAVS